MLGFYIFFSLFCFALFFRTTLSGEKLRECTFRNAQKKIYWINRNLIVIFRDTFVYLEFAALILKWVT